MTQKVLILGGRGQIGQRIAQDLQCYCPVNITVTGRQSPEMVSRHLLTNVQYQQLDLAEAATLKEAIASHDLVIHCAGPFHQRDGRVLQTCIATQTDYLDVSDHRCLYQRLKPLKDAAKAAGITAICNTGVFPGISNSMVRLGVEKLDQAEAIAIYYGVAGSGGAGQTVFKTTFLGLLEPFLAWQDGSWQQKQPYSEPQQIQFADPIGTANVYWFDVAETFTFAESFSVQTVITKFGSVPDLYNQLTRGMKFLPFGLLHNTAIVNALAKLSYGMTQVTDRFTGVGVAMRAIITGTKDQKPTTIVVEMEHEHTAIAAGQGTGMVAELLLTGRISQKGLYPVEQVIASDLFVEMSSKRKLSISVNGSNLEELDHEP